MDWSKLSDMLEGHQTDLLTPEETLVCLGGGPHQLPLIRAARQAGLRTVVVDRNPEAPGFAEADAYLQASITRPAAIRRLLQTQLTGGRICGLASRSYGAASLSAAAIADSLGLPGVGFQAARLFRNKRRLKERLGRAGVRVPTSYSWGSVRDRLRIADARLPLIARPSGGHGKLGVRLLNNRTQVRSFLRDVGPDRGQFLLERVITGTEVTVLGLVRNGTYLPVSLSRKRTAELPLFAEVMHSFPAQLSPGVRTQVHAAMHRIVEATGMQTGPIVAEFLIDARGQAHLVEAAPEVGGEWIADAVAEVGAGARFFESLVLLASGREPVLAARRAARAVVIRYIMPQSGRLTQLQIPPALSAHPDLLFEHRLRSDAAVLSTERGNLDRPFVFALAGNHADEIERLEAEADRLADWIEVKYEAVKRTARRMGRTLPKTPVATLSSR